MGFHKSYPSSQVYLQISKLIKFHVMHESLKLWLDMSFLLSLMCISDIQYVKIVPRTFVEKY